MQQTIIHDKIVKFPYTSKDLSEMGKKVICVIRKDDFPLLKEIRSSHRDDNLPVIMYTLSDDSYSIDYCFNDKCNFYAIKPNTMS